MASVQVPYLTEEQYLALDRAAEIRSEYHDGQMFAMSGGTRPHSTLKVNLCSEFRDALRHSDCVVNDSDLRLRVRQGRSYVYPDMTIYCPKNDPPAPGPNDIAENPILIAEVLSPSTESYDRGFKFARYRTIESLRIYLLVSQTEPQVEMFTRQPNGDWLLSVVQGMEAKLRIECLGCTIPLAGIYEKVVFEDTSAT